MNVVKSLDRLQLQSNCSVYRELNPTSPHLPFPVENRRILLPSEDHPHFNISPSDVECAPIAHSIIRRVKCGYLKVGPSEILGYSPSIDQHRNRASSIQLSCRKSKPQTTRPTIPVIPGPHNFLNLF